MNSMLSPLDFYVRRRAVLRGGLAAGATLLAAQAPPLALAHAAGPGSSAPDRAPGDAPARDPLAIMEGEVRVLVIDGARLALARRVATRAGLLDAAHVSPDGRHLYLASREGWIERHDLCSEHDPVRARVGEQLGSLAMSADGHWLLAASDEPRCITLLNADLRLVRRHDVATLDGRHSSCVAAVRDAPARRSFLVAPRDIPELWEISYDPQAGAIYDGLVHDYRMGEAIARQGFLGVRRTPLKEPLARFCLVPAQRHVIAASPARGGALVVNLDARVEIARLPMPGLPLPDDGALFERGDAWALACPNRAEAALELIDVKRWKTVGRIETARAGSLVRSHARAPHLWTDAAAPGFLALVEKRTLQPAAELRIPPGTVSAITFTCDGRHALVAVRNGDESALVAYDARTLQESWRLPLTQPRGIHGGAACAPQPPVR